MEGVAKAGMPGVSTTAQPESFGARMKGEERRCWKRAVRSKFSVRVRLRVCLTSGARCHVPAAGRESPGSGSNAV